MPHTILSMQERRQVAEMFEFFYFNNCCVRECQNKQTDGQLPFFKLPRDPERRAAWLRAIGRYDLFHPRLFHRTEYKVCGKHFKRSAMSVMMAQKLHPNALPTQFVPKSMFWRSALHNCDEGIAAAETQTIVTYDNCTDPLKHKKGPERPLEEDSGSDVEVIPN